MRAVTVTVLGVLGVAGVAMWCASRPPSAPAPQEQASASLAGNGAAARTTGASRPALRRTGPAGTWATVAATPAVQRARAPLGVPPEVQRTFFAELHAFAIEARLDDAQWRRLLGDVSDLAAVESMRSSRPSPPARRPLRRCSSAWAPSSRRAAPSG